MPNETATSPEIKENVCDDMITALPTDLLVHILSLIPTKDAVATSVLSKPWRYIWTLVPKIVCKDSKRTDNGKSFWGFLEQSLQLHKAPILEHLEVELHSRCPSDVDVGNLILNAIERYVRLVDLNLKRLAKPVRLTMRLYTCKSLKQLSLSNKILIDLPSESLLPSLINLELYGVVYKDEDSLIKLLSGCPILKNLVVVRNKNDNVTNFRVKVSSLESLVYINRHRVWSCGFLMIDSPQLNYLHLRDFSEDDCLIESMNGNLTMARIDVESRPGENILTYLSSVMFLHMTWIDESELFCSAVNYSQLIECMLFPCDADYWVESIMLLLDNAPRLKVLMIDTEEIGVSSEDLPPWSYVPACLSSQLEILEWREYGGTREEKKLLTYILANSKCLKRAGISMRYLQDCNDKKKKKLRNELRSMPRASPSSELLFPSMFKWRSVPHNLL